MNVYLAVDRALTADERRRFLDAFCRINPHWRGAHVADVLEALHERDSHLDVLERIGEELQPFNASLASAAILAGVYLYGPDLTVDQARELLARAEKEEADAPVF